MEYPNNLVGRRSRHKALSYVEREHYSMEIEKEGLFRIEVKLFIAEEVAEDVGVVSSVEL
jgi:hypothetical protein